MCKYKGCKSASIDYNGYCRKHFEMVKKERLEKWNLKKNPFELEHKTNFSNDFDKLIVKDRLNVGVYRVNVREPEQSTFKFDLEKVLPERKDKTRQIRIELTKRTFDKATECRFEEGKEEQRITEYEEE